MLQFRASGVGKLMAYPDKNNLPAGAISHIQELASQIILDWQPKLDMHVIEKGHACEQDAIDLLNKVFGKSYQKNSERITTDLLTGEWDIFCESQSLIIDIKNAYSKKTFPMFLKEGDKKLYEWQLAAYMHLKNAGHAQIAYVLVDTPRELIMSRDDPDWHIVSHIPPELRVTTLDLERNIEKEEQILARVRLAQDKLKDILVDKGFSYENLEVNF